MNLQIDFFKNQINKTINNSQLPIGVVKQIFSNILHDIQTLYNYQIEKEKEKLEKEQSVQINQIGQSNNQTEQKNIINTQEQQFDVSVKDRITGWIPEEEEEEKEE